MKTVLPPTEPWVNVVPLFCCSARNVCWSVAWSTPAIRKIPAPQPLVENAIANATSEGDLPRAARAALNSG